MQNTTIGSAFQGLRETVREHRAWFVAFAILGILLRFIFVFRLMTITPDSLVYGDLATIWIRHHIYGISGPDGPMAVDIRLPGYPAYLAASFLIAGIDHYRAACIGQVFVDLGTCFVVAVLALRLAGKRAARWAFALTALCPFFINYVSTALTETWAIFFTALALVFAVDGAQGLEAVPTSPIRPWILSGLAIGAATLLRPDSGILLIALLIWAGWKFLTRPRWRGRTAQAALLLTVFTLIPLVPWAVRNAVTLHEFQPLTPVAANTPGEFVPLGFDRWLKTWEIEYASQEDIGFNVSGEAIPFDRLPNRSFDNSRQRATTEQLFHDYNVSFNMTPALDARFAELARERIHDSPSRYYLVLPALRAVDMWLRPRTEMLPVDIHWWTFDDPRDDSIAIFLGLWNLALLAASGWALRNFRRMRCLGLLLTFVVVRTVVIVAISLPEPRYALECYPVVLALAGAVANRRWEAATENLKSGTSTP
jgi:4-amino-4-deoxy-L-arabinose transferase-like glycosyltransferase